MDIKNNNNKLVYFAFFAVIIIWLGFHQLYSTVIQNIDSSGKNIIAFGDSLVKGVGSTSDNDFVSVLSRKIERPIINLGTSGDTTADALKKVKSVLMLDPKIVIILVGGNDFLQQVPPETTFANLRQIVTQIQSHGSAVLLLGVRGGFITDIYAEEYEKIARQLRTGYVPNVLDGLLGNKSLMYDTIHPNDAGYQIIADKIEPVLADMLNRNDKSTGSD